jgi:hypothetical protein
VSRPGHAYQHKRLTTTLWPAFFSSRLATGRILSDDKQKPYNFTHDDMMMKQLRVPNSDRYVRHFFFQRRATSVTTTIGGRSGCDDGTA